ncbi:MAG TPA: hypothetical protein VHO01_02120 [Jatrophihabitans sp.]|nr:hypothetical protein [Jatrophihabitans sp.]
MTAVAVAGFALAALAGLRGTWSPCGLSMVSAINPMAERARGYRYWLTAAWFVLGSVAGSLALAAVAAPIAFLLSAASLPARAAAATGALLALGTLAAELRVAGLRLPRHPRQVNELWLTQYRRWLYAAGFGAQIGSGFATYIMTAANYLVVALAALTGRPLLALAVSLCFGLVRGGAVLLSARCRTAGQLRQLHRRLAGLEPWSRRLLVAAQAVAAVALAGAAGDGMAGGGTVGAVAVGGAVGFVLLFAAVLRSSGRRRSSAARRSRHAGQPVTATPVAAAAEVTTA